ncbi:MAG TPA: DUF998 domain-containing protein [Candidatus Lokiarchaeia archaeon]|nr:DUF998 domain-containing protein [Candidatus Lokiarchaeia archaeon]
MPRNAILAFFTGQLSKKSFLILVPVLIAVFYALMVTSAILYPNQYDPITMSISSLGDPDKNPFPGWIFFSLAVCWIAITMLPFYVRVFRQLRHISGKLAEIDLIFCVISSVGLFLLGCFSERTPTEIMHYIAAGLAFGGFFLAASLWWILIGRYLKTTNQCGGTASMVIFVIMVVSLSSAIAGLAISQILASPSNFIDASSWFLQFAFWEWTCVNTINIQLILLAFIIPGSINASAKKEKK